MIKYTPQSQISNILFKDPFKAEMDQSNRWIVLEKMLPWDEMVTPLRKRTSPKMGRRNIDLRYVLGAILIQELKNLSEEDTILAIQENIYMQYFVGLREFALEPLFDSEVFIEVRKLLSQEDMIMINETLSKYAHQSGMIKRRKEYRKHKKNNKNFNL